jgi:hypothetical protein
MAEINTLPASVASQLSFDAVSACTLTKLEQLVQDPNIARCTKTYTAAQLTALQTVAADAFSFQCIGDMIGTACMTYVDQTYLEPIRASLATTMG